MPDHDGSWTYVLVTPDGVLTQSLPWLLEKVRAAGLEPVAGKLVRVRSVDMLKIYASSGPGPSLPPKRAFDLWYGLGPGCVLVLRSDRPGATAAMLELKGATDPAAASADSLRYAGENALVNLVHCPDDEQSARSELSRLVGRRTATCLERLAVVPREEVRQLTVDSLDEALPACAGLEALSMPLVVNTLRLRLLHGLVLCDRAGSGGPQVRQALREERQQVLRAATSAGRVDVARSHSEHLHARLLDLAQSTKSRAVTRALDGLAASVTGRPGSWRGTLAALRSSGTYVSELESAALEIDALVCAGA